MNFRSTLSSSSSSSSSSKVVREYHVAVSYNYLETKPFYTMLRKALEKEGLRIGRSWADPLKTIEESRIYIVVFSQRYADSSSCLYELAKMLQCMKVRGYSFLPVFFNVDPCEVQRWLTPCKTLLSQRPDLVIHNSEDQRRVIGKIVAEAKEIILGKKKDMGDQQQLIDKIVEESIIILRDKRSRMSMINYIDQLAKIIDKSGQIAPVGVGYHRVQKLVKLLDLGSNDVRVVGISGMGGVGKTALAGDVFKKISHLFYSAYFLTRSPMGQVGPSQSMLINVFLRIILQEEYQPYSDNTKRKLRPHRILLVLDDADYWKPLLGYWTRQWFEGGTRIIITGRDEMLLKEFGAGDIHKVELLNENKALQLLCNIVFECDKPIEGYEELILDALKYADGLPLAIISLGSLLVNRSVSEWQRVLTELQMVPDLSVFMVLKTSFDQLTKMMKRNFLDIACCFAEQKIDCVKEILGSQYPIYAVESIISTLVDKSLISISDQKIKMHHMLQQVGKEIVRQESTEPGQRSRIWRHEDFHHIMETNTGTDHVQVIALRNEEYPQGTSLNIGGLSKMGRLRILIFHNIKFSGSLFRLSDNLRYISWNNYPFYYLPQRFEPKHLAALIMPDSYITQLWRKKQVCFPKLRSLNLCGSKILRQIPDFRLLPNLERLDLEGCTSLLQLDPSIASLKRLKILNLRACTSLGSIPNELFGKSSLEFLNLAGCSKFATCLGFKETILNWFLDTKNSQGSWSGPPRNRGYRLRRIISQNQP